MDSYKHIKLFSKTRILLSVVVGICISIIIGLEVNYELDWECRRSSDTSKQIEDVEIRIAEIPSLISNSNITWSDIALVGGGLCDKNREIARAKVMILFTSPSPKLLNLSYSDFDGETIWENRFELSQSPWSINDELWKIWAKGIAAGILSTILSIPAAWLSLLIVSVIWYFLLSRISELSSAIMGKQVENTTKQET